MVSVRELLDLSGRTAVVTGGAMGIGLGIVKRLAEAGANVVIADRDGDAARTAAKDLVQLGRKVDSVEVDVADEAQVRTAIDHAVRTYGGLDILVNNAGIFPNVPLADLDQSTFDKVLHVNLRGVFLFTRYASDRMKEQGRGGSIINVTSIDALHPSMVGLAAYDASKHGVWGFTKNVAVELAPYGIQVNAVAPGGIVTPGTSQLDGTVPQEAMAGIIEAFTAKIPMRRMGEPDEIGKVVLFLASDMASYMTGSQVVVDGGVLQT